MENIELKIKTSPKDFFVFIGSMVSLYTSAVSLLNLLFEIINVSFPDAINFSYDYFYASMRWSISSLIIVFPLYIFLSWLINRDLSNNPPKKNLSIRKWLTYLTLFVAGATIITDLVILINTFLGGEITARFGLKVLTVLVVAGATFAYYIYDLRRDVGQKSRKIKLLVWAVSFGVLVSIAGGFFIMGSPSVLRMKRFDERRVSDLQNIKNQVVNFYQMKGGLPNSLDELKDPISDFSIPSDPESNHPYGYEKSSDLGFKICASFSLDSYISRDSKNISRSVPAIPDINFPLNENWQHKKGYFCFDKSIDKERYPILKDKKM